MIRNIVFDLGNVLLSFEPQKYLNELYDKEKAGKLYECIFLSKEWLDLDRGVITNEEAVQAIASKCPEHYDCLKHVMYNWTQMMIPIEGSVEILESLKQKGYKLYLLSNFHKQAFKEVYRRYDFFRHFDGMLVSSDVYLLKPKPEIFIALCEKYGIRAQESIFIDDMPANVEQAKKLGFNAVQFKSPELLKNYLAGIGIEV